jgi:hypothetical protein
MANPEQLQILKQGVEVWNQWRDQNRDIRPDLGEADLRGANLRGANLLGADLTGANLANAILNDADLGLADLTGANLTHANFIFTDLHAADLTHADLTHAILNDANLRNTNATSLGKSNGLFHRLRVPTLYHRIPPPGAPARQRLGSRAGRQQAAGRRRRGPAGRPGAGCEAAGAPLR